MPSKTISELAKLSANLTAFDLPVHEGSQVSTSLEPVHTPDHTSQIIPTKPIAREQVQTAAARQSMQTSLSVMIHAAGTVDGFAPEPALLRKRTATAPIGGAGKRALDIVVATTSLVLLSPLLLIVALAIYARMGRPILFSQMRVGFHGHPFHCLKFRTMVQDAETALREHLQKDREAACEWRARQKLEQDPRITSLGRVLRRSSIDELPQLFNVLTGDMSCVGPRPIVESEIARYGMSFRDYAKVRPGLTGLWQVSGRNRVSYTRRVALDRSYVRRWSFWLDVWILIKTIPAILRSDTT